VSGPSRWPSTLVRRLVSRVSRAGRARRHLQLLIGELRQGATQDSQFDRAVRVATDLVALRPDHINLSMAVRAAWLAARADLAHPWAEALAAFSDPHTSDEKALISDISARSDLLRRASQSPSRREDEPKPRRVLNVLAFTLPYFTNGYAIRSHGLLRALMRRGWDMRPVARPGFPADSDPRWRDRDLPDVSEVDGVMYRLMAKPSRRETTHTGYLDTAVVKFKELIRRERPTLVHAASNHMTALPALIAAREMGVPFIYEVRGFWDMTRASSDPAFTGSSKHRHMQLLENAVCHHADRLLTLTTSMKRELVLRGCAKERIHVVHNAVDTATKSASHRDSVLVEALGLPADVPVIGYIGSFVDYEGLDDLIAAAGVLRDHGKAFRLLLVGDGIARERVLGLAFAAGLGDVVCATGRVAPSEVASYYSLIDVAVFPRKPWPVCELVSPLKPYEAMAFGKAVLVTGTEVLREMVDHERTGLICNKGDLEALVASLERLLDDSELRSRLGEQGRRWVNEQRSWDGSAHACESAYRAAAPLLV
jgi:glycosyltransferase involved in cell wall biosynthesis